MVRCRTDFGAISDEFPMDFSDGGGGPNAPRNDWGIVVVEFLVRPNLGLLDVCFRLEIGIIGGRMGLDGGELVVVVRVVQIHDANRNKNNWRVDKRTAKGDF
jgi:hypothetical protein